MRVYYSPASFSQNVEKLNYQKSFAFPPWVAFEGEVPTHKKIPDKAHSLNNGCLDFLANPGVPRHYVLDLWVEKVVRKQNRGAMVYMRYADDFVVGFEYGADAEWFFQELPKRLAKFGMGMAEDKSGILRFRPLRCVRQRMFYLPRIRVLLGQRKSYSWATFDQMWKTLAIPSPKVIEKPYCKHHQWTLSYS